MHCKRKQPSIRLCFGRWKISNQLRFQLSRQRPSLQCWTNRLVYALAPLDLKGRPQVLLLQGKYHSPHYPDRFSSYPRPPPPLPRLPSDGPNGRSRTLDKRDSVSSTAESSTTGARNSIASSTAHELHSQDPKVQRKIEEQEAQVCLKTTQKYQILSLSDLGCKANEAARSLRVGS